METARITSPRAGRNRGFGGGRSGDYVGAPSFVPEAWRSLRVSSWQGTMWKGKTRGTLSVFPKFPPRPVGLCQGGNLGKTLGKLSVFPRRCLGLESTKTVKTAGEIDFCMIFTRGENFQFSPRPVGLCQSGENLGKTLGKLPGGVRRESHLGDSPLGDSPEDLKGLPPGGPDSLGRGLELGWAGLDVLDQLGRGWTGLAHGPSAPRRLGRPHRPPPLARLGVARRRNACSQLTECGVSTIIYMSHPSFLKIAAFE